MAKRKIGSTIDAAEIEAIVGGYHGSPYAVLGMHSATIDGTTSLAVRAFRPIDKQVFVLDVTQGRRTAMQRVHADGFFEAIFRRRKNPFAYRLVVVDGDGNEFELNDPYRFPLHLTEYDMHLHNEGNFLESYEKLGPFQGNGPIASGN